MDYVKILNSADIKRADLLGISPFANRIAFVQVKGSVLLEAMRCAFQKCSQQHHAHILTIM
nr:5'-nucleotidase C-terminal domain-containing protein [Mycoplasmopsis bovis]